MPSRSQKSREGMTLKNRTGEIKMGPGGEIPQRERKKLETPGLGACIPGDDARARTYDWCKKWGRG